MRISCNRLNSDNENADGIDHNLSSLRSSHCSVAQFIVLPVQVTVQLTKCCVMHTCDKLVT